MDALTARESELDERAAELEARAAELAAREQAAEEAEQAAPRSPRRPIRRRPPTSSSGSRRSWPSSARRSRRSSAPSTSWPPEVDALTEQEAACEARARARGGGFPAPPAELELLEARIRRLEQGGRSRADEAQTFSAGLRALQQRGLLTNREPDEPLH